jgi:hypothetical protein
VARGSVARVGTFHNVFYVFFRGRAATSSIKLLCLLTSRSGVG